MSDLHEKWSISELKTTEGETMILDNFGLVAVVTDEGDAKQIIADREARTDAPQLRIPVEWANAPLRYALPNGKTYDEMRDNVRKTDLYKIGDTILVWVNEGDFWMKSPVFTESLSGEAHAAPPVHSAASTDALPDSYMSERKKAVYEKLAEEGGGTWATYMMMDIEEAFAAPTTSPEPGTCKDSVQVQSAPEPTKATCPHCDGTGDVHRADGEWLGSCDCASPRPDAVRDAVWAALESELGDTYDCTRVWDAWNVGTMREDDFIAVTDRLDEIVETVLAALSAPVAGEWQDISTAPKDGTPVIVCIAGLANSTGEAHWWQNESGVGGWQTWDGANHTRTVYTTPPTHWQPLPTPLPLARHDRVTSQPDTAICEICSKPGATLHVEFDGFACAECQASWTEKSEASE